jgi:hypothetical protein
MEPRRFDRRHFLWASIASLLCLSGFVALEEISPKTVNNLSIEDGWINNITAIFFGFSSLCLVVACARSQFLKNRGGFLIYTFTLLWALGLFVFMGEEISWGQRVFGYDTPDKVADYNEQGEFNLHNLWFMKAFLGGTYMHVSILMLMTGLVFPLVALTRWGKILLQKFAFPVSPLGYWPLFVGAYAFGKYYHTRAFMPNDASEMRELLLSVGMLAFSLHGAIDPDALFCASPVAKGPLQQKIPAHSSRS